MDDRQAFINAIQAEPNNDIPRLVYADWLEDEGDEQAELIRVQCAIQQSAKNTEEQIGLKAREQQLLSIFDQRWIEPLKALHARDVYIQRGFVDEIRIRTADYATHGDAILDIAPALRVLNLRRSKAHLREFLQTPRLERIRAINLRLSNLESKEVAQLATSERLQSLQSLNLYGNHIADDGCSILFTSPFLTNLQTLDIGANTLTGAAMISLVNARLPRLRELVLSNNDIDNNALQVLSEWRGLADLERLELSGCFAINLRAIEHLVSSDNWNAQALLQISRRIGGHTDAFRVVSNRRLAKLRGKYGVNIEYIQDPFYRLTDSPGSPD